MNKSLDVTGGIDGGALEWQFTEKQVKCNHNRHFIFNLSDSDQSSWDSPPFPLCVLAAVAPQTSWTWWWMDFLSLSPPTRRRFTAAGDSASLPAQRPDPPSSYWLRRLPAVTSHLNQMAVTAPSCPAKALTTPHPLTRRSSHHTSVTGMSGSYMLPFQMTRTLERQTVQFICETLHSLIDSLLMQCSIYSADGESPLTAKKTHTDWLTADSCTCCTFPNCLQLTSMRTLLSYHMLF